MVISKTIIYNTYIMHSCQTFFNFFFLVISRLCVSSMSFFKLSKIPKRIFQHIYAPPKKNYVGVDPCSSNNIVQESAVSKSGLLSVQPP